MFGRIISIGTAVPQFGTNQNKILKFMIDAYQHNDTDTRKLNLLFKNSGIEKRYSSVPDFEPSNENREFFAHGAKLPNVEERLDIIKKQAIPLALEAANNAAEKIGTEVERFGFTHLVTVTCTGLHAPGIDIELIQHFGLPTNIFHISVNFLGCNAAFHALKIADLIVRNDNNAKVLIVCVELCTLHFQPKNNHDNLLSNTIFGDGAAAAIVTSDSYALKNFYKGFDLTDFYSGIFSNGKDLMGWNITPVNFEMILDAKVPEAIGEEISNFAQTLLKKSKLEFADIGLWAIHPGGKKILDTILKSLNITAEDLYYSYKVLKEHGNMSSPTILFVLKEMEQVHENIEKNIFSIGFGPGLSFESAILKYVQ